MTRGETGYNRTGQRGRGCRLACGTRNRPLFRISSSIEVCELLGFNGNGDLGILKGLRGSSTEERESIRWTMLRIAAMAVLEPTQTEFRFWIECLKKEEAFSESLVRILDQISGEDRLSEVVDLASKTVRPIQQ